MSPRSLNIALWGWYQAGNYGDDLMALMVAGALRDHGHRVTLFAESRLAQEAGGVATTRSLNELLHGADLCVVGGGGLLINGAACETSAGELAGAAARHNVPLWLTSVGADGVGAIDWDSMPGRRALLESPHLLGGTIRTRMEDRLLESRGLRYYPDIVLRAGSSLGIERRPTGRATIGINVPPWGRGRMLAKTLLDVARTTGAFDVACLQTAHPDYPATHGHELVEPLVGMGARKVQFESVRGFLEEVATMSAIVSFKLHLGVSALSMGTPFIGFGGGPKVQSFFQALGASSCYYGCRGRDVAAVLTKLAAHAAAPQRLKPSLKPRGAYVAIEQAKGHFDEMHKAIDRVAETRPVCEGVAR
ncbi:Polysaccharide pyruvyl transferase [Pseudobythopirellula maris]|uniref:Polysaccharide pyruvyl transferase n=1 Tax=Pseudobythopirellula maris TaxID=2527991 RepID=A0A5C5ZJH8_9BACT|nr:polysaccharide pyruvyl transferase family protein [Pseudobythopirellula maris]TWT87534.1 Polysaccharide pyruvyl transferase [Pseudobythopirellula maris]